MRRVAISLGLAIAVFTIYWPAIHSPFVFDDQHVVEMNPFVKTTQPIPIRQPRVLTIASLRANYRIGGDDPTGFHIVNIIFHLLNGLFVWMFLRELTGNTTASLLGLGFFLLHPLQSQAVIYTSARAELMMTFGALGCVLSFMRKRWIFAVLYWAFAALSKDIGFILPPLLCWVYAEYRGMVLWKIVGLPLGGIAVSAVLSPAVWFYVKTAPFQFQWMPQASYAVMALFWRVFWPFGLTIDHSFPETITLAGVVAFAILFSVGLAAWMVRRSLYGFSVLWILVCMFPRMIGELPGYMAEHHLYVPFVGLALIFALLFEASEFRSSQGETAYVQSTTP